MGSLFNKQLFFPALTIYLIAIVTIATASIHIEPSIFKSLEDNKTVNILITFKGSDLSVVRNTAEIQDFRTRGDKVKCLYHGLRNYMNTTQTSLMNTLKSSARLTQNIQVDQLWITNQVSIKNADKVLIGMLSRREDIAEITEHKVHAIYGAHNYVNKTSGRISEDDPQWGVEAIDAPAVWSQSGNKGAGVVVAVMDTGVRGSHEALRDGFRKEHGWYDPEGNTLTPTDDSGHGTHVTGIILGRKGGIGVAPEAQWIACKACGSNTNCDQLSILKCAQWVMCPTDINEGNSRCDLAPQIVSNSWGGDREHGIYDDAISNWIAAGIVPVFAAGNDGLRGCYTVGSPGTNPNVISVGSLTRGNTISRTSSRGPSRLYRSIQPDVAAPGDNIYSSYVLNDTSYIESSGTSMAAPHVSGLIALLFHENPDLSVDQVRALVLGGAKPINSLRESCNGVSDSVYPNNQAGAGGVNAFASIEAMNLIEPDPGRTTTPSSADHSFSYGLVQVLCSVVLISFKRYILV